MFFVLLRSSLPDKHDPAERAIKACVGEAKPSLPGEASAARLQAVQYGKQRKGKDAGSLAGTRAADARIKRQLYARVLFYKAEHIKDTFGVRRLGRANARARRKAHTPKSARPPSFKFTAPAASSGVGKRRRNRPREAVIVGCPSTSLRITNGCPGPPPERSPRSGSGAAMGVGGCQGGGFGGRGGGGGGDRRVLGRTLFSNS